MAEFDFAANIIAATSTPAAELSIAHPVTITLVFDSEWAGRLGPMIVEKIDNARVNPVILALLDALGIDSVDDLTTKQKAKLWILFHLLKELVKFERQEAATLAGEAVANDIADNFPLEVGDA